MAAQQNNRGEWSQQQRPGGTVQWWGTATRDTEQLTWVRTATHTHHCTQTIKNTHDYTHRYTGQERACMQTQTHQAMLTSACTHPTNNKCTCMRIFVSVHIEHINSCLLLRFHFLSGCLLSLFSSCLHHHPSSFSIKFQGSVIFHISITGDSPKALQHSRSRKLCPTHQSDSRILSCAII